MFYLLTLSYYILSKNCNINFPKDALKIGEKIHQCVATTKIKAELTTSR